MDIYATSLVSTICLLISAALSLAPLSWSRPWPGAISNIPSIKNDSNSPPSKLREKRRDVLLVLGLTAGDKSLLPSTSLYKLSSSDLARTNPSLPPLPPPSSPPPLPPLLPPPLPSPLPQPLDVAAIFGVGVAAAVVVGVDATIGVEADGVEAR
jgi:hypothetical protein